MGHMMLTVENYPDLKSDQTMLHAMQTYNETEAQITAARRFYNSAAVALNNAIEIFPGNIIANMLNVKALPLFEAEEAARASIDVNQFL
jgi:LemA protein